jgi:hypothetical protein
MQGYGAGHEGRSAAEERCAQSQAGGEQEEARGEREEGGSTPPISVSNVSLSSSKPATTRLKTTTKPATRRLKQQQNQQLQD